MSQITAYSSLYPYLGPELPGCDLTTLGLSTLKAVGRDFCKQTGAWRQDLLPIKTVEYQAIYDLTHKYSAYIHRILQVFVNGQYYEPDRYELHNENQLHFMFNASPHDIEYKMLSCGTKGTAAIASWKAITDACLTVDVDGETYEATADLSSASDFDDVAQLLQTAIRAALESTNPYVIYDDSVSGSEHFVFYLYSSTVGYLTAGTTGTDISGATWLNGLTGTGTLSGHIIVEVIMRPQFDADDLPDWFMDRWGETLVAGAVARLARRTGMPYGNPTLAQEGLKDYHRGVTTAMADNSRRMKSGALDFSMSSQHPPREGDVQEWWPPR